MPDRLVSEAVADLRISDRRLAADLAGIRRQLLTSISHLEADARVTVGARINEESFASTIRSIQSLTDEANPTITVGANVDTSEGDATVERFGRQSRDHLGAAFGQAGESSGRQFGQKLGDILQATIGTLGAAAGGFVATALVKGYGRLTTISDATASLTVQLGSATKAASLLDAVLGVVRGTPFNLDQFARAASNMTAFGIEASKIPGYLTAIGEASATRGSQANEVASRLAVTFGQVSAAGRLTGQDVQSFSEAGVNALAILGNAAGKTTVEMRDLISSGVIPADRALDALRDGILNGSNGINGVTVKFAGTMANLRDTLTGSIGGFSAATARLGVSIIKPFEKLLTEGFGGATDLLDSIGGRITTAFAGFSDSKLFATISTFFDDLPGKVSPFLDQLSKLGPLLAPLGAAFGATGLNQLASALPGIGKLIPGALTNPLYAAIAAFVAFDPQIRDAFMPLVGQAAGLLKDFGVAIGPVLIGAIDQLEPALLKLVDVFSGLAPLIGVAANFAGVLLSAVVPVIGAFAGVVEHIPVGVLQALLTSFLAFKALDFLTSGGGFFQHIASGLTSINAAVNDGRARNAAAALSDNYDDVVRSSDEMVAATEEDSGRVATALSRAGVSAQTFARVIGGVGAAVGGAFGGMALASEDASTRMSGGIASIGALAAGFATGGPWGLAAAGVGVAVGGIIGYFQRGNAEAEALKKQIAEVSATLVTNTLELTKNTLSLGTEVTALQAATENAKLLNDALLAAKGGDELKRLLTDLGLATSSLIPVFTELANGGGKIGGVTEIVARLNSEFGPEKAKQIAEFVDTVNNLDPNAQRAANEALTEGLTESQRTALDALIKNFYALRTAIKDAPVGEILKSEVQGLIQNNDQYRIAADLIDRRNTALNDGSPTHQTLTTANAQKYLNDLYQVSINQHGEIHEIQVRNALIAAKFSEEQIVALQREAYFRNVNILDLVDLGAAVEASLGGATVKATEASAAAGGLILPLTEAQVAAQAFSAAVDLAKVALQAASDEAATLLGALSATDALANFNAGIRAIGTTLSQVTNQQDLDKRPGLSDKIDQQIQKIQQLQADVDKEQGDADARAKALGVQLDEARAANALGGVALIEREIATVNEKADKKRADLSDAQTDLAKFRAELGKLSSTPVTLQMVLLDQAGKAHLSLFDLLETGITDESLSEGEKIRATIKAAVGQVTDIAKSEGPAAAAELAQSLVGSLREGFVRNGLDADTADRLIAKYFDVKRMVDKYNEQIDAATAQTRQNDVLVRLIQPDITAALAAVRAEMDAKGPQAAELVALSQRTALIKALGDKGFPNAQELVDRNFDALGIITGIEERIKTATQEANTRANADLASAPFSVTVPVDIVAGFAPFSEPIAQQVENRVAEQLGQFGDSQAAALGAAFGAAGAAAGAAVGRHSLEVPVTPKLAVTVEDFMTTYQQQFDKSKLTATIQFVPDMSLFPRGVTVADLLAPLSPGAQTVAGFAPFLGLKDGGILRWSGGEDHTAHIAPPGAWRVFAEPETGGEGYIPLAASKRERSTQTLVTIAELFGLQVLPKMPVPQAVAASPMVQAGGMSWADADLIGQAVARHTAKSPHQRAAEMADRYDRTVHIEPGGIVVQEAKSSRRTAAQLVAHLADLSMKR